MTKIIAKQQAQVLGIFRALPEGGGRLVPVDKKAREREIQILPGDEGEAQDGDLVARLGGEAWPHRPADTPR